MLELETRNNLVPVIAYDLRCSDSEMLTVANTLWVGETKVLPLIIIYLELCLCL